MTERVNIDCGGGVWLKVLEGGCGLCAHVAEAKALNKGLKKRRVHHSKHRLLAPLLSLLVALHAFVSTRLQPASGLLPRLPTDCSTD